MFDPSSLPRISLVLAPSRANAVLLRQQAMLAGPYIRVTFSDPDDLIHQLARPGLHRRALRREPTGWLETAIEQEVTALPSRWTDTLTLPGWTGPLADAVRSVEATLKPLDALRQASDHPPLALVLDLTERIRGRRRSAGFASPDEVHQAALEGLTADLPCNRPTHVVLYADRVLGPAGHGVLRQWLATRTVERVLPPPFHNLPPAPIGLQAAAPGTPLREQTPRSSRLGAVQHGLFGASSPTPSDDSVRFVRTPDDVREIEEVMREALAHVERGVPLYEIAIAVPDARHIEPLRHALTRAGLPATTLVGPPLTTAPAARFLAFALDLASRDPFAEDVHTLFGFPGLRLRAVLGEHGTRGRARWRRLLVDVVGLARGAAMADRLRGWDVSDARDPEGDRAAREALILTLDTVLPEVAALAQAGTWDEISVRWTAFLTRWWPAGTDRAAIQDLLSTGGDASPLSLTTARARLDRMLAATPQLQGQLADAAIRVAPPMSLLGGQFRVVLATGLTDGRLPLRAQEDPFLPDRVVKALNERLGLCLLGTALQEDRERRRFAALAACCTEHLWLSSPALDMAEDRPTLPSPLLLDVLRAVGERVGFGSLRELQVPVGSRSDVLPAPDRALDVSEHRAARLLRNPAVEARWFVSHPARRAHVERTFGRASGSPNPHNGLVSSPHPPVPGRDGTPIAAHVLSELLLDPDGFFVRRVLGAWPPRRFPSPPDPFAEKTRRASLIHFLRAGEPDLLAAFDARMAQQLGTSWVGPTRDMALQVARSDLAALTARLSDTIPAPIEGQAPDGNLPWRLEEAYTVLEGEVLTLLDSRRPKSDLPSQLPGHLLALAAGSTSVNLDSGFTKPSKPTQVDDSLREQTLSLLQDAEHRLAAGWWNTGRLP